MIDSRSNELEDFKRHINLTEFAASYGFAKDVTKSSKSTVVMRDSSDYIILISMSTGDHWQYFSPSDEADSGTIIDFVKKQENCNLGHVRKILRQWRGQVSAPVNTWQKQVKKSVKDIKKVTAYLQQFKKLTHSDYLLSRGISNNTINSPGFFGRILSGYDDAVIFPHFNEKGVCGYEVKKAGFTSFSEYGDKTFWLSHKIEGNNKILFFENPIEALSYCELNPETAFYLLVSPCGNWSPDVGLLIKKLIIKNKGCEFYSAFNNDEGGDRQHSLLNKLMNEAINKDVERITLENRGEDWNEALVRILGAPKIDNNN